MPSPFPSPYAVPGDLGPVIKELRELEASLADRRRRLNELATAPQRRRIEALIRLRTSIGIVEVCALHEICDRISGIVAT